jgi:thioredoxin reductase (NADPH)
VDEFAKISGCGVQRTTAFGQPSRQRIWSFMIGADPCTKWLRGCVDLDPSGFVRTSSGSEDRGVFETSVRGIFAVGDVRSGSVKRVASAVGEGSVVVAAIHRHLGNF